MCVRAHAACTCVCAYVNVYHLDAGSHRGQKRALGLLELQKVVKSSVMVLGIELGSSAESVRAFT